MAETLNYVCKKCGWALINATFKPRECYNCYSEVHELQAHKYEYFVTNIIKKLPLYIEK